MWFYARMKDGGPGVVAALRESADAPVQSLRDLTPEEVEAFRDIFDPGEAIDRRPIEYYVDLMKDGKEHALEYD